MEEPKITHQHTFLFTSTGESVTAYVSDTRFGFQFGLAFNHKGEDIKWYSLYETVCQIQSKVNPEIWFIWLTEYWNTGGNGMPVETVLEVRTCTADQKRRINFRNSTYEPEEWQEAVKRMPITPEQAHKRGHMNKHKHEDNE